MLVRKTRRVILSLTNNSKTHNCTLRIPNELKNLNSLQKIKIISMKSKEFGIKFKVPNKLY